MILCVISSFFMLVRQDLQDILDYLLPHHFPEESDEKQSAFGEGKKTMSSCFDFVPDRI